MLRQRGIATLLDAISHLPYRYIDMRIRHMIADLHPDADAIVDGRLENVTIRPRRFRSFKALSTAWLSDAANRHIRIVWFNLPAYTQFPANVPVLVRGRVSIGTDGKLQIVHPEVHSLRNAAIAPLRPVYRLPPDVPQRLFASIVAEALGRLRSEIRGALPEELCRTAGVLSIGEALEYLHRPPGDADAAELEACETPAHRALALDEMFAFELALARERARSKRRAGAILHGAASITTRFMAELPFAPTRAQLRAINEIERDLAAPSQMNRMLIGDVGSGKTLVAFWAALRAAESGYQAAIMAPTELLAEQHHRNFNRLCGRLGAMSALLIGKLTGAERARTLRALERGDISVVFGTQALIQESVRMFRLGLAMVDEQHRFGVFDRARLMALGSEANVLMMTATPIPRSLALTLFRNLDASALDEMPPGRAPITTRIFSEDAVSEVDAIVRDEIALGHRAYYVLPLIEDEEGSDEGERKSVAAMAKRLAGSLAGARIGTLHGRMRPAEKERVMREFRDGAVDVLVATTVVEVGIDVPEATVMVVIAADRYGLAQLHQLRGRVGRGAASSSCYLIASRGSSAPALERLAAITRFASGAEVADADLRMRGPGDLIGARQAGALPLRFAGFIRDFRLIEQAGDLAEEWLRHDPDLELPASAGARQALQRMLGFGFSLGDIG
jgi:ATP-dependent DNA helicase RecG